LDSVSALHNTLTFEIVHPEKFLRIGPAAYTVVQQAVKLLAPAAEDRGQTDRVTIIETEESGVTSLGRRSQQPVVSPADGHLLTPTVAGRVARPV